jgi:hypothetical protein
MSRSTKGYDTGAYGTVLISSTLRIRRFACGSVEHATQPDAIHRAAVYPNAQNATGALVHHHQHPVRDEDGRFPPKQIDPPQAVLRMPENREPGVARRVRLGRVPSGENAPHDILVHGDAEGQGDLLRDSRTTPCRIPLFHVDDGRDDLPCGALGAGLIRRLEENSRRYFRVVSTRWRRRSVEGFRTTATRTRRLGRMNSVHRPATTRSERGRFGERRRERLRINSCCLTRTDFGPHGTRPARTGEPGDDRHDGENQDGQVTHGTILTI